jgi:hypothetical protein
MPWTEPGPDHLPVLPSDVAPVPVLPVPPDPADLGPSGIPADTAHAHRSPNNTAPLGMGLILTGLGLALTFQALRLRRG